MLSMISKVYLDTKCVLMTCKTQKVGKSNEFYNQCLVVALHYLRMSWWTGHGFGITESLIIQWLSLSWHDLLRLGLLALWSTWICHIHDRTMPWRPLVGCEWTHPNTRTAFWSTTKPHWPHLYRWEEQALLRTAKRSSRGRKAMLTWTLVRNCRRKRGDRWHSVP